MSGARVLGLFRVVLALLFLISPERSDALRIAELPRALWQAPEGLGWFLHYAPIDARWVTIASRVYLTAAAFVLFGLYTRLALGGLCVSAFYLFAIRQLGGTVLHDMHLLWFLALLTASNSATRFSVDAWLDKAVPSDSREQSEEQRAQSCLFWIRTLLGLVYFFPGFWKLKASGLGWALSDNLANQMHAKWFEYGAVPSVRLDAYPALLKGLGLATIAFELGFVLLVHLGPRVRMGLLLSGLLFHLAIEWQLLIPFASLWVCYVALLGPGPRLPMLKSLAISNRVLSTVGAILTVGIVERGARGEMQSFPFACYPTFHVIQGDTLPDLYAAYTDEAGTHFLDLRKGRSQQAWGEVWSVLGLGTAPYSDSRLRAYLPSVLPKDAPMPLEIGVGSFRTAPERWSDPPVSSRALLTLMSENNHQPR
jgi:hypothetical protein